MRALATMLAASLVLPLFGAAQNMCIGYLKAGDVTVRCGGVRTRITRRGDLSAFAVDEHATTLVVESYTGTSREFEITTLPHGPVSKLPWRANGRLSASCGTVVLRESRDDKYEVRDLASNRTFSIPPYSDFACTPDRTTVVGLLGSSPVALKLGTPPQKEIANAPRANEIDFSVSRSGTQIAYALARDTNLCVVAKDGVRACMSISQFPVEGLSVSDDGTVLYSVSDDACTYNDPARAAHRDCNQMYRWKRGLQKPELEGVGNDPQWLTTEQASALRGLSGRQDDRTETRLTTEKQPVIDVSGNTVIAFFPPVTNVEQEKDPDTNESLADFQHYAAIARGPLRKAGIQFHELYVRSFRVRIGQTATTFRPAKVEVGYYFVAPGKKPRIEYGVMTDNDIIHLAKEYFGLK